jgi:Fe-Mn family superoxide dismutase
MHFRLPRLPFEPDALRPYLSEDTVKTHYFGHHKNYITKMNQILSQRNWSESSLEKIILHAEGTLLDNAQQAWNHTFLWHSLAPEKPRDQRLSKEFLEAVHQSFGDWANMQRQFAECANQLFGSGYTWLVADGTGGLEFMNLANGNNPLRGERVRPLWCCDLWEHAYYLDYRFERKRFIEGTWDHINWNFVENNFQLDGTPNMTQYMVDLDEARDTTNFRFENQHRY